MLTIEKKTEMVIGKKRAIRKTTVTKMKKEIQKMTVMTIQKKRAIQKTTVTKMKRMIQKMTKMTMVLMTEMKMVNGKPTTMVK